MSLLWETNGSWFMKTPGLHTGRIESHRQCDQRNERNPIRRHLWGGSAPPMSRHGTIQYLRSLEHFMEQAQRQNVRHDWRSAYRYGAWTMALSEIAYARKRMRYMPNIYLIGQKGFRAYCQLFRTWCYDSLEQLDDR